MQYSAKYFDGLKPMVKWVTVSVGDDQLLIQDETSLDFIEKWNLQDIHRDPNDSVAVILKSFHSPASIEVTNPNLLNHLSFKEELQVVDRFKSGRKLLPWFLAVITMAVGFYLMVPTFSRFIAQRLPERVDREVLGTLDPFKNTFFCDGKDKPEAKAALEKMVRRIYPLTPSDKAFPIEVHILDHHDINAITLPGGRIYLFNGLIRQADSPEEIMGVLAHEIEHAKRKHVLQMIVQSSLLTAALGFVSGDVSGFVTVDPATMYQIAARSFNRNLEKEADAGGLERMGQAQVSTQGIKNFFAKMKKLDGIIPAILSTHPSDATREAMVQATLGRLSTPVLDSKEWSAFKKACSL